EAVERAKVAPHPKVSELGDFVFAAPLPVTPCQPVTPAKAGAQSEKNLDSRLRGNDGEGAKGGGTRRLGIAEALREGITEAMAADARVFCIGEDIGIPGGWGGAFTVTLGLEKRFPERMINTPIVELGAFGVATGAALMGLRPIADVQYG